MIEHLKFGVDPHAGISDDEHRLNDLGIGGDTSAASWELAKTDSGTKQRDLGPAGDEVKAQQVLTLVKQIDKVKTITGTDADTARQALLVISK